MNNEKEKQGLSIGSVDTGGGDFVAGDQHKGDIVYGNQYNTPIDTAEIEQLFEAILEGAKDEPWPREAPKEITQEFPTQDVMVGVAFEDAKTDILGSEPDFEPEEFETKQNTWFERFKAASPKVIKGGLVVGEAVIETYVKKSPVVAGLLAAINFAKEEV